jgi:thiamine-phosphate pyrophosphorylase
MKIRMMKIRMMQIRMMQRREISGIYAVTPETEDTTGLVAKVTAVLSGGVDVIQYRNKNSAWAMRREQCVELLACVRAFGGVLIVNDSSKLALEIGADGVHLGRDDESVEKARSCLGPNRIIGVSCYNELESARAAQAAGADYVAFGSFFPSPTKPAAVRASMSLLRSAKAELKLPVVSIGGINMANAAALIAAGADALAIISGLFHSNEIEKETRKYVQLFASPKYRQ